MFTNKQLIVPYVAPYFAYILIASVFGDLLSIEVNYFFRIVVSGGLLLWVWKWYAPLALPGKFAGSIVWGLLAGILATVLWILLLTPFVTLSDEEAWSKSSIVLRFFAAGFLVPIFEEMLMRCYVFRVALQWDKLRRNKDPEPFYTAIHNKSIHSVAPGEWSWMAVVVSTLIFSAGHQMYEWPASIIFSLLMSCLWIYRKDLLSCIVAHGATNIILATYVVMTGNWQYW